MLKVMQRRSLSSTIYILLAASFLVVTFGLTSLAHADNPSNINYNVYVKPSLSIIASSNTVAIDLNPNSKQFGTANLDVTVGTNNQYGYKLFMNTDSNTTSLERNQDPSGSGTPDGIAASIPTLSNGSSANPCTSSYTTSTFTTNSWGYRINNNVDGEASCVDTTGTNFYSYTPGTLISSSNQASNNKTANLTFGAKIDYNKPAGEYDLTLKFKALPTVTTYYMQDIADTPSLASTICTEEPTVVLDKRDEQSYTIRRINGDCWMVENLKFGYNASNPSSYTITVDPTTTNVDQTRTLQLYDVVLNGATASDKCGNGGADRASYLCVHSGNDGEGYPAVWYNYPAGSAGTVVGTENADPQLYDVCPAGWRLPNRTEYTGITGYFSEFHPVLGGTYNGASLDYANYGDYLSSSAYDAWNRYRLVNDGTNMSVTYAYRGGSRFIRCIMKDTNINNLTYMQDFAKLNEAGNSAKKQQVMSSITTNTGYSLKDVRDTNSYTIKKLDTGDIWMTDNLLFQGTTLDPSTTNVTTTRYINGSSVKAYYKLPDDAATSSSRCYGDQNSGAGDGYIYACMNYTANDTNIGGKPNAWYNYAAATAGTISGSGTSTASILDDEATEDICPTGWRLPTNAENLTLYGNTEYVFFTPVLGGAYKNSLTLASTRGYWWSSTAINYKSRARLGFDDVNNLYTVSDDWGCRSSGFYIRCIAR